MTLPPDPAEEPSGSPASGSQASGSPASGSPASGSPASGSPASGSAPLPPPPGAAGWTAATPPSVGPSAGQPYPGQQYPPQPYPGQQAASQRYAGQPYPPPPYPPQQYAGQQRPGPYPPQPYPGEQYAPPQYAGQPYPPAPYPPQQYAGQPYPPAGLAGYPQPWPAPAARQPTGRKPRWGEPRYEQAQPYHRIPRVVGYRGWRPVLGLLVMLGTFAVVSTGVTLVTLLPTVLRSASGPIDESELVGDLVSTPIGLLGVNLSLAVLIPAAILGLLAGHQIRPGFLHSVVGRFRWRFLGLCLLLEGAVWLVTVPLTAVVTAGGDVLPTPSGGDSLSFVEWLPFALVILLTTPLQAAGEEYGFRGYGMQALGAWVRNPWFAIGVTSVLFAMAHGGQSLPLFLDRLAFGVVAGLLTVRTGGLEAAIAFHVVNNMVILLLASAADQLEPSLTVSEAPWGVVAVDVLGMALYAVLALWLARRMRLVTATAVSVPASLPAGPVAWSDVAPPRATG